MQQEILIKSLGPSVDLSLSANNRNTGGVSTSDGSELAATISMTMPILVTPSSKAQSQKLISNLMAAQINTDEAKRAVGLAARAGFRNHISAKIQLKAAASEVEAYRLDQEIQSIVNEIEVSEFKPDFVIIQWSSIQRGYSTNLKEFFSSVVKNKETDFLAYDYEYLNEEMKMNPQKIFDTVIKILD